MSRCFSKKSYRDQELVVVSVSARCHMQGQVARCIGINKVTSQCAKSSQYGARTRCIPSRIYLASRIESANSTEGRYRIVGRRAFNCCKQREPFWAPNLRKKPCFETSQKSRTEICENRVTQSSYKMIVYIGPISQNFMMVNSAEDLTWPISAAKTFPPRFAVSPPSFSL